MARPTSKEDLITASSQGYEKLMTTLNSMSSSEQNGEFHFDLAKEKGAHWARDKNIRDVLIHLYAWQVLLIDWLEANENGKARDFLPEGYNWRNYGEMNVEFRDKYQATSYEEALDLLANSHQKVMKLLDRFTNEELFSKKVFPWTGNNTLGAYFVSNTSSHYDWALKKIRKYQKSLKKS